MSERKMRCAMGGEYCLKWCDERPVWSMAVCWRCWFERFGRRQAVSEWKAKHWWRRLVP